MIARLFIAGLFVLFVPATTPAANPLRAVPDAADMALVIDQPRAFVEAFTRQPAARGLTHLAAAREFLDGTLARRFFQLVEYYEKDLGHPWPELLDQLAGNGMAFALRFGNPPPSVLVVAARDEALLARFFERATGLLEEELARTESPQKLERRDFKGVAGVTVGDLHMAIRGPYLIAASKPEAMSATLETLLAADAQSLGGSARIASARKQLPAKPLAWMWLDLERARQVSAVKQAFSLPKADPGLLIAGMLTTAGRSPHLTMALEQSPAGMQLSTRMAAGRDGMAEALALHLPLKPEVGGSLPPLEPKGTVLSTSFYLDLAALWEHRMALLGKQGGAGLEKADKDLAKLPLAPSLSKLLTQSGAYHRFVMTGYGKPDYTITPGTRIPPFAFVTTMRDPAFGQAMEALLRGLGLLASARVELKMAEEEINGVKLVGYRFVEGGKFPNDPTNARYNFTPCFARVGEQFLVASTLGLGRELVAQLQTEAKQPAAKASPAVVRTRVSAAGLAELLLAGEDQLLAQTVLDRAVTLGEAKREVAEFVVWLKGLGTFGLDTEYTANEFRLDMRLNLK